MKSLKSWTFCVSFLAITAFGAVAQAEERCTLRFNRDEIDVVRGEIRIDLNRRIQRECRGLNAGNIRLDQVTVELRDDRRSSRDDYRNDRGRRRGGDTVPVYRYYDGRRHLMSDSPDEQFGDNEGVMFELYRNGGGNRRAVYRCATARGDRFLTKDSRCEGHNSEGQLGYIAEQQDGENSRPVYRCFNGKRGDHIATTDQQECSAAGYAVEFTLGYVR